MTPHTEHFIKIWNLINTFCSYKCSLFEDFIMVAILILEEAALAKTIELYQIKSKDNVADMFTKSLESPAFIKFRDIIMGMRNPKNDPDESSE